MHRKELKQKLRKLKKLEMRLRYGFSYHYIEENACSRQLEELPLVWKEMFCLQEHQSAKNRYTLDRLERMNEEELGRVFEEYWFRLYFRMYQEKGMQMTELQDPELLTFLGLPYEADAEMVKKRFRELCKLYHPDVGGDQEKFIELMEMIEKHQTR